MDREVRKRGLDLYSTGRYASRKEAEAAARDAIDREKAKQLMARTAFIPPLGAMWNGGVVTANEARLQYGEHGKSYD